MMRDALLTVLYVVLALLLVAVTPNILNRFAILHPLFADAMAGFFSPGESPMKRIASGAWAAVQLYRGR